MLALYKGLRLGLRSGRDAGGEPSSGDFLETEGRKRNRHSPSGAAPVLMLGIPPVRIRKIVFVLRQSGWVTEKNRLGDAAWMRKSKEGKVVLIRKRDGVVEGTQPLLVENGLGVNRFRSLAGVYRDRTSGGEV